MLNEHTFARNEIAPSWWANMVGEATSTMVAGLRLSYSGTTVSIAAAAGDRAVVVAINGTLRWIEAPISRVHPGGAAGAYDVFVTAAADSIAGTVDSTNRAFALAIVAAGSTPTIVAGTLDIYRKVGSCTWDGTQITSLSQTVPAPLTPPRVTALPSSPVDGQEVYFVADAANGVVWHLVYNATSASPYKWEYRGGPPVSQVVSASEGTTSLAATDLTTVGPQFTLPGVGGDFDVQIAALTNGAGGVAEVRLAVNGALVTGSGSVAAEVQNTTAGGRTQAQSTGDFSRLINVASSATIKLVYSSDGVNTVTFSGRKLRITPVRVG